MIVEIQGVNGINKGASLMLKAVLEQKKLLCARTFAVNFRDARTLDLKSYNLDLVGFFPTMKYHKLDSILQNTGGYKILARQGRKVHHVNKIGLLLDASGFAYSDKWGAGICEVYTKHFKSIKNNGGKIILLPQAMGPFNQVEVKDAFTTMISYVDLLFARDSTSLDYLASLGISDKKIKQAPDFTNVLQADSIKFPKVDVILVPNMRVIDKGGQVARSTYINYWKDIISWLHNNKYTSLILNHEGRQDSLLCNEIANGIDNVSVYYSNDPLEVKSRINSCRLLVGSRFHSLVSALSQNIPVIANGWSHKYKQLLADYGHIDYLDERTDSAFAIQHLSNLLDNDVNYNSVVECIANHSLNEKNKTNKMWKEIQQNLN